MEMQSRRRPSLEQVHLQMLPSSLMQRVTIPYATAISANSTVLRDTMAEHGFCVVSDVVDETTLQRWESLWADDLRSIIHTEKSDPNAAKALALDPVKNWPMDKLPLGMKFASDFGLPQGRMA